MAAGNYCQECAILAIDDEEGFLGLLKAALECQGYRVHTASSPHQAIKFYGDRWRDIGMVLLDFLLPQMSGDLVFDELQRLNPDVRVVLLTGCEESVAEKMFRKGLRGYLQKPVGIGELGQKIRDAIDARAVPSSVSESDISGKESQAASFSQKGDGATTGQLTDDTVSSQRRLPDPEICRTTYVVQSDLLQCLVEDSDACEFAIRFSSGIICRHPDRRRFETTD